MTRAVVEIELIETRLNLQKFHDHSHIPGSGMVCTTVLLLDLIITVVNKSMQSANVWGINLKTSEPNSMWQGTDKGMPLSIGVSERGVPQTILPDEIAVITTSLSTRIQTSVRGDVRESENDASHNINIMRELLRLKLKLRPVSQNFIGKEVTFGCGKSNQEEEMLMDELLMRIDKARDGYRIDKDCDWRSL